MKLKVIGAAEDLSNVPAVDRVDQERALPKPRSEDGLTKIRKGFFARPDGKLLRHRTMTQPDKLGKNEPHPMASFLPASQFGEYLRVHRLLRVEETVEIERIGQGTNSRMTVTTDRLLCVTL